MLVRSVALLIIDAIGFRLYVRKCADVFRFVVLYCIVVLYVVLYSCLIFFRFLLFLSLGDEIKLPKGLKLPLHLCHRYCGCTFRVVDIKVATVQTLSPAPPLLLPLLSLHSSRPSCTVTTKSTRLGVT